MNQRSPICACVGHVDHGKSSILDNIRGTAIVAGEAGKITQAIGASIIPIETIKGVCGSLLESLKLKFTIPGILFIDTPGHAAFTNLRKRGGNLADIAILVVDVNEGFKPQTEEAIEILQTYKTPFIVAANKVDLVPGWVTFPKPLLENIKSQGESTTKGFETKLYEIVGKLSEKGLQSERYDRVDDFTKQIAIVPCSAKTGEGIPELLMMISGLAQRFLEDCLKCDATGDAKGTILEVKDSKGMGTCVDVIIYDGSLKVNDTVVIGGLDEAKVTKVRALFEPAPLSEMRDRRSRYVSLKEVHAATGVRIAAPGLDGTIAGMPIRSCRPNEVESVSEEIQKEVDEVIMELETDGVVIKADTLGSLEALSTLLNERDIPVKRASIGNISKKDISEAQSNFESDPLRSAVLGFNVSINPDAGHKENVKVLVNDVIYRLIEDFEIWMEKQKKVMEERELDKLTRPCRIEFMLNHTFRQSNPAVIGVDILAGVVKTGMGVMKKGRQIGVVKSIQSDKESVSRVEKGKQVAVSIPGGVVGRNLAEGDILYSMIPEDEFRKLKEFKKLLSKEELEVMREIASLMREDNPVWGV